MNLLRISLGLVIVLIYEIFREAYSYTEAHNYTGEAGNYTGEAGNYTGEAGNYTGGANNYIGEASNYTGEANNYTREEASNYTGESGNYTGEAGNYTDQPECRLTDCICNDTRCITNTIQKSTIENEVNRCCKVRVQVSQGADIDMDQCIKREGFFTTGECFAINPENCRSRTLLYYLYSSGNNSRFFNRVRQDLTLPASEDECGNYTRDYIKTTVDLCKYDIEDGVVTSASCIALFMDNITT